MKNVRDIRTEESKYYILSSDVSEGVSTKKKIAIAINLYYEDLLEQEYLYIDGIPSVVDIFLFSSQISVIDKLKERYSGYCNIVIELKENRGRDLSALLVTFKKFWDKYDYVCFVHDKKTTFAPDYAKMDIDFWEKNLWTNSVGTREFIENVINLFETEDELGLLVPPEPEGMYTSEWSRPRWYERDFENVKKLSALLKIESDIVVSKPPFTLGSVFWCRQEALRKLWKYDWKYNSFPEEPMPTGGTISHAIERIIGYVVQDAGFSVGTVMNATYTSEFFSFLQKNINKMMYCHNYDGIPTEFSYYEARYDQIFDENQELINYLEKKPRILIYGAGKIGKETRQKIERLNYKIEGFIVTKKEDFEGKTISLDEYKKKVGDGIIIAVSAKYIDEIKRELEERGITDYFSVI